MNCNKEHEMIELEIETCKENIKFYETQIDNMEEKLAELERLKKEYDYY
ncbi:MAG: hypothetical protein V1906_02540 [Candidatus Woesearchaeota archaeon]